MKKFLIILSCLFLVGCTSSVTSNQTYESLIMNTLNNEITHYNTLGKGFKYYKPRDFSIYKDENFNHVLLNKGNKYFLNVDINGYYNKYEHTYSVNPEIEYSKSFEYNDMLGYLEIRKGKKDYFYIKMMYNYSYIEVNVKENELKPAVVNSIIILSSIKYNDKVIDNFISQGDLNAKEITYEIRKPNNSNSNKNILDVYDKDQYSGDAN